MNSVRPLLVLYSGFFNYGLFQYGHVARAMSVNPAGDIAVFIFNRGHIGVTERIFNAHHPRHKMLSDRASRTFKAIKWLVMIFDNPTHGVSHSKHRRRQIQTVGHSAWGPLIGYGRPVTRQVTTGGRGRAAFKGIVDGENLRRYATGPTVLTWLRSTSWTRGGSNVGA